MNEIVSNFLLGLAILAPLALWAGILYLMAVPDRAGPGTRVWHLRDVWDWLIWKTLRR